jgi:nitrate reductase assembly molybdenum cofactor insertion protein NarJ
MDSLHTVLRTIRPETKSAPDHFSVFREFLAHLDALQRRALAAQPRAKPPARRKPARRVKV